MTKKIVLGAAMALLSLASCYNGGNKAETANKSMSFDEVMTSRRSVRDADKLRELFAIPGNETVMAVIALGYRAEEPTRPERKSLAPRAVSTAVAIDAIICTTNFKVSFLVITVIV